MECGSNQIPVIVACIKNRCSSEIQLLLQFRESRESHVEYSTRTNKNVYMFINHITELVYMGLCI